MVSSYVLAVSLLPLGKSNTDVRAAISVNRCLIPVCVLVIGKQVVGRIAEFYLLIRGFRLPRNCVAYHNWSRMYMLCNYNVHHALSTEEVTSIHV